MAVIGSLSVKLGLVTVEWDQATAKAKAQAKDLQKSFNDLTGELKTLYSNFKLLGGVTTASALGLAELMSSTLSFSNEVKDLAGAYDISIAKTLQFRDALQTSGGNAEQAGRMLSTMFAKIGEAQQGNEKAIYSIEKLGISFEELRNLKPEDSINRVVKGLSQIAIQAERSKIMKELFGRGAVTIGITELAEKVNKSAQEFEKHADAIKRFGDVSDNIKTTMDNLKIAFADLVSPFLGTGLVSIEKFKAAFLSIASVIAIQNLTKIVTLVIELRNAIVAGAAITAVMTGNILALGTALVGIGVFFGAKEYFSEPIKKLNDEILKAEEGLKRLENLSPKQKKKQQALGIDPEQAISAQKEVIEALKKQTEAKAADTKVIDEQTEALKRESDALQSQITLQMYMLGIDKQINILKVQEINNDKYLIEKQVIELNLLGEVAKARTELAKTLSKSDLSQREAALANSKYRQDESAAIQKANASLALAESQRKKEISDIIYKKILAKDLFQFDVEGFNLRQKALTTGAYEIQLAEAELATRKSILQKQNEFELATQNMSILDEKYLRLKEEHEQNINQIRTTGKATSDLIVATKAKELSLIDLQMKFAKETNDLDIERLNLDAKRYYMTQYEFDKQNEIYELTKKLAIIEQQRTEARLRLGKGAEFDKESQRLDQQIELEKRASETRTEIFQTQQKQRTSFSEGWDKAFRDYAEAAQNYGTQGADAFKVVTGSMEKAINDFVDTGKFAFGDFVKSIIMGLIKIQLQMQASQLLGMGGGLLSGLFSKSGAPPLVGDFPASVPMAANGGDIGGPTIVGERGPELFIPKGAGTIIPNNQMASAMGGPQITYNGPYIANMQAIDTQSATQFLARNKLSVYAANQSASRSLPTSR
jgi:lambda family phage tail tape measure protein